ncbi:MAG: SpoIID/LytB domain-containing protein [Nocardioidaceae bacterium]
MAALVALLGPLAVAGPPPTEARVTQARVTQARATQARVTQARATQARTTQARATEAARPQSYPVPADGVLRLRGHGYGHGRGMSQYGALGAARRGLDHRQILAFYYPGTTWGTVRAPIRVRLTADTTRDVVVGAATGLRVLDLGSGRSYPLPDIAGVRRWRLNVDGRRTVVGYLTSRWNRYRPGGLDALTGDGQLSADGPLTLWTPEGSRTYRGALRAASPAPGSAERDTVNVLSLDQYVAGVLPAEMSPSWDRAALEAQAVAARTYATFERDQHPDRSWHVCDTSSCQVYRGVGAEHPRANQAVAATSGRVLLRDGRAAFTQFSASSGGWLVAGTRPYLVAKADPYDGHAGNPVHDWTVRLPARRVETAYPRLGSLRRLLVTGRDGRGEWGGRVRSVVLDGTAADVVLSGDSFRSVFGLRSAWFAG